MKKPIAMLIILLSAITLLGCEAKKTDVTQTVDWYVSHNQERKEMVEKCRNNPGELGRTPNCTNAVVANRLSASSGKPIRF